MTTDTDYKNRCCSPADSLLTAADLVSRRLSENEIVFSRSRKAEIITTGIH